jgi:hypothetical protein
MKNTLLFLSVLFTGFIFSSCEKTERLPDQISYENIDKVITLSSPDSIQGACKDIIFAITQKNTNEKSVVVSMDNSNVLCDAFSSILVTDNNNTVLTMQEGIVVSGNGNWTFIDSLCLDDYAGKGPMYVGYRVASYPSGITDYYYGWIKVELTSDKTTLKLYDRASNYTANNPIVTGQKE